MNPSDSVFYFDTTAKEDDSDSQTEKVTPASYGLVNPDLQAYFKSCEGMLDSPDFETGEDRALFVNNLYNEMKGYELQLTTDHECSRILEKLFRISSEYQIKRFFSITRDDTIRLAIHRFSSHTIQTLLLLSAVALEHEKRRTTSNLEAETEPNSDSEQVRTKVPNFEELVLGLVDTLTPHWAFLMSNEYASHIQRVLLLVLTGKPIEDQMNSKNSIKSRRSAKYMEERNGAPVNHRSLSTQRAVPDSFAAVLDKLLATTSNAMSDYIARGFVSNPVGSPVLQLMLQLQVERGELENPGSLLDKCLMGLLSDAADNENSRRDSVIGMMLEDTVGSHFLQKVLELASRELLQTLYDRYFSGKLQKLAFHPISNFVVQSMFANAKSPAQLKSMIAEVVPIMGDLLFKNRPGVVRALADSCVRLGACYTEIMNALYNGLGVSAGEERRELINLLAFLTPYPVFVKADYFTLQFTIQGSLIIQSILRFPGDAHEPIMSSYFGQDRDKIYSWCKDPSGSRIIEAIIASPRSQPKTKRRVLEQFTEKFADLAVNKYGSHIVDACWNVADITFKEKILKEIIQREARVLDSPFGRIVMRNCGAEQYKRRADEWRQRVRNTEKRKRMFKDIIDVNAPTSTAKRHMVPGGA
ncbi:ARM repeat-containing protein [Coemansia reversa NRRL 1564]|uniref:Nucleolar protein 9 n=1 Tax=Coemansia reversa (strain ATCC 12441 / NRRL 1564) TaxID=763665 RepID=A0A2G5BHA2_COERN|nr:ARM repeat-containing protein [Coemansia reversa NRRL 1564]|eukprot:PIA18352.1 ARM repeat-containing protein [Coemansia reversa NRRL 1564]